MITAKKLTVYWDNVTEDSWKAGTRHVNCNLAALLPDRSGFAPVTGSVRGPVTVGDTPAPPAANTPEPGVPAQVPPVTPAPSPPATPTKDTKQPSTTPGPSGTDAPPLDAPPAAPAAGAGVDAGGRSRSSGPAGARGLPLADAVRGPGPDVDAGGTR